MRVTTTLRPRTRGRASTRFRAGLAAALLAAGLCNTASAEVVELKALEKRALERHFSLRAASARERAAEAGVREARAGYMPHVGVNVDSTLGPGRNLITLRDSTRSADYPDGKPIATVQGVNVLNAPGGSALRPQWRTTATLVVGATLYDFGRTGAAVAASRARHAAAGSDAQLSRAQVIAGVRQAYLTWLSSHELHRLSASGSDDSARRTERVTALIEEGARPRGDFAPVESDRLLAELELERAIGELEGARILLESTVGEPLPANAEPDLSVLNVHEEANPKATTDPALQMLIHQRAALEATARVQRKAWAPILSANLSAGMGAQKNLAGSDLTPKYFPSYVVGLGVALPVWDGGGSRASAAASEARADELRIRLESSEADRQQERARARLDAQHAEKREATALKLVEICKTRVADTEAGYELGAMQFDQVQQARTMLRRAETEVVLARVARAEAVLRFAP